MGTYTTNLNLYNTNMLTDGNDTFDFQRDLNDNNNKIDSAIGKLANLTTTTKDNLVNAINEVKSGNFANQNLSNLSSTGEARLHALKGYLDEGEVLTDAEGLADVINMFYSSFDASKFTVEGTPTINNGVISDFSSDDYLTLDPSLIDFTKSWVINCGKIKTPAQFSAKECIISINNDGSKVALLVRIDADARVLLGLDYNVNIGWGGLNYGSTLNTNTEYYVRVTYDTTKYTLEFSTDNKNWTAYVTISYYLNALDVTNQTLNIGRYTTTDPASFLNTINLKYFSIINDGAEIFRGNETGTDTYTIGGNTITIPYTLSNTGSKIVDSSYRTLLTTIYNAQGIALYRSLDGISGNYTLPMGELYGMIERKTFQPDWANALGLTVSTEYTAPSNGYVVAYQIDLHENGHLKCTVNNTVVMELGVHGLANVYYGEGFTIPVAKGDVYKVEGPLSAARFVPVKEVY